MLLRSVLILSSVYLASAFKDYGIQGWSCNGEVMKRSATAPQSVHSVRFADIGVIAAIGDSITAGNGAGAAEENDIPSLSIEHRGLAFSVGGDKDLDQHVTLANILKKFNPNLFGFSVGAGQSANWTSSQLNAAVPGAKAGGLFMQAIDLVQRFTAYSHKVDIANDWKLIHMFIGGNDICEWCADPKDNSPALFGKRIAEAIQLLKNHLPRTIVVITGMMDITLLREMGASNKRCIPFHNHLCPCIQNANFTTDQLRGICNEYMREEDELQFAEQFQSDDFAVIVQPFMNKNDRAPRLANGSVDFSLFAPDCFHFSAYGHAIAAKNLWNNMLQPLLIKAVSSNLTDLSAPLSCPDPSCPFIRTTKNSENCGQYMTPVSQ